MDDQRKPPSRKLSVRQWVQVALVLLTVAVGVHFALFIFHVYQRPVSPVVRPPAVEAFLPIGAIMSWKAFLLSGHWDAIHPAAMVIFGFAVLSSFLLGRMFCGWLCPIGTASEWLWRLCEWSGWKTWKLPKALDIPLRGLKYLLLGFFLWAIVVKMSVEQIQVFLESPYYKIADAKMLFFFLHPSTTTVVVLGLLVLFSFKIKQFFCRYLCPYGALLGLVTMPGPTRIRRNPKTCTQCGLCDKSCFCHLPVSRKKQIVSPECIACMRCVEVCPQPDTLTLRSRGLRTAWTPGRVAVALTVLFLLVYFVAQLTGNWHGAVSDQEYFRYLKILDSDIMRHP